MTESDKVQPQDAGPKPEKEPGNGRIVAYAAIVICLLALCVGAYYVVSTPATPGDDGNETIAVPGHPDWYTKPLDVFYTNGTRIAITENRNARSPGYWQLISFLMDDPTEKGVYAQGHGCSNFAVELHDALLRAPPHQRAPCTQIEERGSRFALGRPSVGNEHLSLLEPAPEDDLLGTALISNVAKQPPEHGEILRRLSRLEDFLGAAPERRRLHRRELRPRWRGGTRLDSRGDSRLRVEASP
jgi:hypothetical protein